MSDGYELSAFEAVLLGVLPADIFRDDRPASDRKIWVHGGNVWTMKYVIMDGHVTSLTLKDEWKTVQVWLLRKGVESLPALLKAIGAVPAGK